MKKFTFYTLMSVTLFLAFGPVVIWFIMLFDPSIALTLPKGMAMGMVTIAAWLGAYAYYTLTIEAGNNIALRAKKYRLDPSQRDMLYDHLYDSGPIY